MTHIADRGLRPSDRQFSTREGPPISRNTFRSRVWRPGNPLEMLQLVRPSMDGLPHARSAQLVDELVDIVSAEMAAKQAVKSNMDDDPATNSDHDWYGDPDTTTPTDGSSDGEDGPEPE